MMRALRCALLLALIGAWPTRALAVPITIDFESFADSESLTTQIPGLTFEHASVLTSGISLNEFEFPPRSGVNVLSDNGGPIGITFTTPTAQFGAYLTYLTAVTLFAYDAGDVLVGSVTSAFGANMAISGDPGSVPNEHMTLAFGPGIKRIVLAGDPGGGSFTLDDLTYSPIPEPASGLLLLLAAGGGLLRRRYSH